MAAIRLIFKVSRRHGADAAPSGWRRARPARSW